MTNQTKNLEIKLTLEEENFVLLRARLHKVPKDTPVKLHMKKDALLYHRWDNKEPDIIFPTLLMGVVSSMDSVPKEMTPDTRPHKEGYVELKVKRENYFRRLGKPYEMVGYVSQSTCWGSNVVNVRSHPNFYPSNRELFVEISAIESFEVL